MPDTPSRDEIAARLEAVEARTETRIAQLSGSIEARFSASDHKMDTLACKIDSLVDIVSNMRSENNKALLKVEAENKATRSTITTVGIGSVLAVLGLVASLYTIGLSYQANLASTFQAGLGARGVVQENSPSGSPNPVKAPPVVAPSSQMPPAPTELPAAAGKK